MIAGLNYVNQSPVDRRRTEPTIESGLTLSEAIDKMGVELGAGDKLMLTKLAEDLSKANGKNVPVLVESSHGNSWYCSSLEVNPRIFSCVTEQQYQLYNGRKPDELVSTKWLVLGDRKGAGVFAAEGKIFESQEMLSILNHTSCSQLNVADLGATDLNTSFQFSRSGVRDIIKSRVFVGIEAIDEHVKSAIVPAIIVEKLRALTA